MRSLRCRALVNDIKLLYIATALPWPLNGGYKIRLFENLRLLAESCQVTVVSMTEGDGAKDELKEVGHELPGVRFIEPISHPIHIRRKPLALARVAVGGLLKNQPYKVVKFSSKAMGRALSNLVMEERFDIVCTELATWSYISKLNKMTRSDFLLILDQHNIESELIRDYARNERSIHKKLVAYLEYFRTAKYEKTACRSADMVFTISEEDRRFVSDLPGCSDKSFVVPAIASEEVEMVSPRKTKGRQILFVGQLSWPPNESAIRWFADNVLPRVRERMPDAQVRVIGSGVSQRLEEYFLEKGIEAPGYVDDLSAPYNDAAVFIAPFLVGGGIRIKILDAIKSGLPIVTTSIGSKGLTVKDGDQVLIADEPRAFADAVFRILDDPDLAVLLASRAQRYLQDHHSRISASRKVKEALVQLDVIPKEQVMQTVVPIGRASECE